MVTNSVDSVGEGLVGTFSEKILLIKLGNKLCRFCRSIVMQIICTDIIHLIENYFYLKNISLQKATEFSNIRFCKFK